MDKEELMKCSNCNKNFYKIMTFYPGSVDEKRISSFECPYCGWSYSISLRCNEDVSTKKNEYELDDDCFIRMYKCGFGDCFRISDDKSLYVDFGYMKNIGCPDGIDKNHFFDYIIYDIKKNDKNLQKDFLLTHYHEDHYNGAVYMFDSDNNPNPSPKMFKNIYIPDIWRIENAVDAVALTLIKDIFIPYQFSRNNHISIFDFIMGLCKTNGIIHFVGRGDVIQDKYIALWPSRDKVNEYAQKNYRRIVDQTNIDDASENRIRKISRILIKLIMLIVEYRSERRETLRRYAVLLNNIYVDMCTRLRSRIKQTVFLNEFKNYISIVFQNLEECDNNVLFTGDVEKDTWGFIVNNEDNDPRCDMYEKYKVVKAPHHGTRPHYKDFNTEILLIPNFWRNKYDTHYIDAKYLQDAYENDEIIVFGDNPRDYFYTGNIVKQPYKSKTDYWINVI